MKRRATPKCRLISAVEEAVSMQDTTALATQSKPLSHSGAHSVSQLDAPSFSIFR